MQILPELAIRRRSTLAAEPAEVVKNEKYAGVEAALQSPSAMATKPAGWYWLTPSVDPNRM